MSQNPKLCKKGNVSENCHTAFEQRMAQAPDETAALVEQKRCYKVGDIKEILQISRPMVYELIKRNEFKSFKIGSEYRIIKESFDKWLNAQ